MNSPASFSYKIYPLILWSLTPLHPGTGRAGGTVDLPVQRDSLGYPVIYSSSLKGSLKKLYYKSANGGSSNGEVECEDSNEILKIFGGECVERSNGEGVKKTVSGKCIFTDQYLLVIPARSLKGVVIGVTSPFLIKRISALLEDKANKVFHNIENLKNTLTRVNDGGKVIPITSGIDENLQELYGTGNDKVMVNELEIRVQFDGDTPLFANTIANDFLGYIPYKAVVIIDDDTFKLLLRRSMEIRWRVRLNDNDKVVKTGPWSEEFVPPYTIFVGMVLGLDDQCANLSNYVEKGFFIGGDETIGAGLVKGCLVKDGS